ncbi:MAG: plasmid pRiA4b ORF-3 family protein [Aggregatilineales bacterium]
MADTVPPIEIYQFRVSLKGISPVIWRRLLLRSDHTLADVHYSIQVAMNWSNYYLHQFIIYGKRYAVARFDAEAAEDMHLHDLRLRLNGRFLYEYSFFEWWQHEIRMEKKLALDPRKTYPMCIAGERVAPREDCGGAESFMEQQDYFSESHILCRLLDMLDQFQSGERPDTYDLGDYRAEIAQFRYWLNTAHFDRATVNRRLKWYAAGDERWAEDLEVL